MQSVTVPLALAAGFASFASPCFVPLLPAYLALVAGDPNAPARGATASRAAAFVVGFTVVFVAAWASLGLLSDLLGAQRGTARVLAGLVLVVLGLHLAGVFRLPVLDRQHRLLERIGRLSPVAAAAHRAPEGDSPAGGIPAQHLRAGLLGAAFAAGWTPCIGPILAAVIGVATLTETAGSGLVLLLAYSLGLGLPFVLVALGAQSLHRRISALGRHRVGVSAVSGLAVAATGIAMATGLLGRLSGLLPQPPI